MKWVKKIITKLINFFQKPEDDYETKIKTIADYKIISGKFEEEWELIKKLSEENDKSIERTMKRLKGGDDLLDNTSAN